MHDKNIQLSLASITDISSVQRSYLNDRCNFNEHSYQ